MYESARRPENCNRVCSINGVKACAMAFYKEVGFGCRLNDNSGKIARDSYKQKGRRRR